MPVVVQLHCRGEVHSIEVRPDRTMVMVDHDDHAAELVLLRLGGKPSECLLWSMFLVAQPVSAVSDLIALLPKNQRDVIFHHLEAWERRQVPKYDLRLYASEALRLLDGLEIKL